MRENLRTCTTSEAWYLHCVFEHANLVMLKQCGEGQQVLTLQLEEVLWTGVSLNSDDVLNSFFEWMDGGYIVVWIQKLWQFPTCGSETVWVFFSQEIFWEQMEFESKGSKVNGLYVVFTVFETLGILGRGSRLFLAQTFCLFSAIFLGPFLSDQWHSIYRQSFVGFKMSSGANIMH